VNINDLREHEIPDIGYVQLEDEETGEQILVDTSDPEFQKNYATLMNEQKKTLTEKFRKLKIDVINLKSHEAFVIPLKQFFAMRMKRMVR
jgi:hypothetical protein